ncbi:MAG TPA: hypothetical protein VD866_18520 [Urbifossiella sp.]|nr:hypothetical protein [Urbifossiella sp.]
MFPNAPADAQMSMFTSFCPLCGGVQGVESRDNPAPREDNPAPAPPSIKRPWWKFW